MADTATEPARLDEVMLAMDVVDTLRHRQLLVERELGTENREQRLIARLREIYEAQGIEVPDHVLAEGVAALREDRFTYRPPAPSFAVTLARVYVKRRQWGKPALVALLLAVAIYVGNALFISGPEQRRLESLPRALAAERDAVSATAKIEPAVSRAQQLYASGVAALERDDADTARRALEELQGLRSRIDQEYELRIVTRPGERSGVWRVPDVNPNARNFYLIVEAVGSDGKPIRMSITSEEDGQTRTVDSWGVRVDEQDYRRVVADKQDDGIIQGRRIGLKRRGYLDPDYLVTPAGGHLTDW